MTDITLTTTATRRNFTFSAEPEMPLRWLGSGIEAGALWFLGRGFFAIRCTRRFFNNPMMPLHRFEIAPVTFRDSQLQWAATTKISRLVEDNVFPRKLVTPWKPDAEEDSTVIDLPMNEKYVCESLAFLAYGFADISIGLFKRGATSVAAQFSVDRMQYRFDLGMDEDKVKEWLFSPTDYEAHETVSDLL